MAFKDLNDLHRASLETENDDLFNLILGGKVAQARYELDWERKHGKPFKLDSDPIPPKSGANKSFPVYTVGQIQQLSEAEDRDGWLCPLFLRIGDITILAGEAKRSGKTTLYLHMLKCVHDGKPFMGMPTRKSGALVLTEQGTNILEAAHKAGIGENDEIYFALYRDLAKENWTALMQAAVKKCQELGVKILVIDTFGAFTRLRGSDENLSGEIRERMGPVLDAARVHGLHCSVLHHLNKDGDIRGSSAFKEDVDAVWVLKRPVGEQASNVRALDGMGRYDELNTYFNIALEDDRYKRLGTNAQIERAAAQNELLKMIPVGPDNPKRRTLLVNEVSAATGVSERTVRRALEDMIEKHQVRQAKLHEKGTPGVVWRPDPKRIVRVLNFNDLSKEDQQRLAAGNLPGKFYCGRGKRGTNLEPSEFGNHFIMGKDKDCTRDDVLELHRRCLDEPVNNYKGETFDDRELAATIPAKLRGNDLVCHCAPLPCHCDELLRRANMPPEGYPENHLRPDPPHIPRESGANKTDGGTEDEETPVNKRDSGVFSPLAKNLNEAGGEKGGGLNDFDPSQLIETPEYLTAILEQIRVADRVALDLETRPPDGWMDEFRADFRKLYAGRKTKMPKLSKIRPRWKKEKEKRRKALATDTDVAVPRVMSVATEDINVLIDLSKVDPTTLLEVTTSKILLAHNAPFDLAILRSVYQYTHEGKVYDTELLYTLYHYAHAGEQSRPLEGKRTIPPPHTANVDLRGADGTIKTVKMTSLEHLVYQYMDGSVDKESQTSDWSKPKLSPAQISYALNDSLVLLELTDNLLGKLSEIGMDDIVALEARALPATIAMATHGFPADKQVALDMAERYRVEAEAAHAEAMALTPPVPDDLEGEWNFNADAQIRMILRALGADIDKKGFPKTGKTKEPSTAAKALSTITKPEPARRWVAAYQRWKSLIKLSNDFAGKYAELIRPDGTIRGKYRTVSTGRLSCASPNLQQVPTRGETQNKKGMRIRDIFRPLEGDVFVVGDFGQLELLLAATVSARETRIHERMLEVFKAGKDIHTATASSLTGKPPSKITKAERNLAKSVNFGLIYGSSASKLRETARDSYKIEMTKREAETYRNTFFSSYPELKAWHMLVEAECQAGNDISSTPLGRRRKLPIYMNSGEPAHTTGKNAPIQGAGGDSIKLTMAKLFEDRHGCPGNPRLVASIHDEVVVAVATEHAAEALEWVKRHMAAAEREAVLDEDSPVVVDAEVRESWG
jgi:DNA polymerase I-like protein with 3'-5' exonuclease and polymerase domains